MANTPEPRFGIIPLPLSNKDEAVRGEMLTDSNTGHIYFKNDDGEIISKTVELEKRIEMLELMSAMASSDISISGSYLYDLYSKDKIKNENLTVSTSYISNVKHMTVSNSSDSITAGIYIPIPLSLLTNEIYYFILNEYTSKKGCFTGISLRCINKDGEYKNIKVLPVFKNIDNGSSLEQSHCVMYTVNTKNLSYDIKDYRIVGIYLFIPNDTTTDIKSLKIVRENAAISSRINNDIVITPDILSNAFEGFINSQGIDDGLLAGNVEINLLRLNLLEEQYALDIQYNSLSAYINENITELYLVINGKSILIGKYDLNNITNTVIHTIIDCKYSKLQSKYNIDDDIYSFRLLIKQVNKNGGDINAKTSISSISLSRLSGAAYKTETIS